MALTDNTTQSEHSTCPICTSTQTKPLLHMRRVPVVCNNLGNSYDEAVSARMGDINFTFCDSCGHCFNASFDDELMEYGENYETSLHFSERFRRYATNLAARLLKTYDLKSRNIIELGCGQAEFLAEICALGDSNGFGFDQSYNPSGMNLPKSVTVFSSNYDVKHKDIPADLLCCRHVLEHVPHPTSFLTNLKTTIAKNPDAILYFEVPNGLFTLNDLGIWDLIYEHYSYFWDGSLRYLFEKNGFNVLRIEPAFDSQFLTIDLRSSDTRSSLDKISYSRADKISEIRPSAEAFGQKFREKVSYWTDRRQALSAANKKSVIWGAGSKGVTFLNLTQSGSKDPSLNCAVDISPRKKGKFIPGTGQEIVSPAALRDLAPDVVFLMNATYRDEVERDLESLGIKAELELV